MPNQSEYYSIYSLEPSKITGESPYNQRIKTDALLLIISCTHLNYANQCASK